ncbi:olfactory receptor 14A16-like [Strix uralensis]|uniref:olfactory receptor 14A16-like n=1 Tax=Strix uralensis TaxID=36305 RepID=UPI003DA73637
MSNSSSITEFLLLAFADTRELQLLHFWLFLGIYLAALLGNGLIITAIACDHHLHTPMYFFLLNLSLLDLGSISTTLPKAMANSLWDKRAISYYGCATQVFFFYFFASGEYFLLTLMSYDRYVAICKPLHYRTLLGSRACVHMAAAAWGTGFLYAVLHTANTFSLPLCQGNALDQFFCEISQILKLSCSQTYLREVGLIMVSACLFLGYFFFIVVSYVQIFKAVLRIPSNQGCHKAFSTCLPHLFVVSLFISTVMVAHLKPPSISSPLLNLVVSFLYSVVPPAVNPLIYSMRNQELKDALKKLIGRLSLAIDCQTFSANSSQRPLSKGEDRSSVYLSKINEPMISLSYIHPYHKRSGEDTHQGICSAEPGLVEGIKDTQVQERRGWLEACKRYIAQEKILDFTLFNIFLNSLEDGVEITLTMVADDSTEGGEVDTSEGRAASQRDLDRLEEWSRKNKMKFNKGV